MITSRLKHIMQDHIGAEQAVSRKDLMQQLKEPDRVIREAIAELQKQGILIVSLKSGYYIADNPQEVQAYVSREWARAESIRRKMKIFIKALRGGSQSFGAQMEVL